jgi:uncharacterized protein YaaQ
MPTLDHAFELTEKLSEEKIEYLIICIQKSKDTDNATYFLNVNDNTVPTLMRVIKDVLKDLESRLE